MINTVGKNNSLALITGGCSFSDPDTSGGSADDPWRGEVTWPVHLEKRLPEYQATHTGSGSFGNGIISRRIIYSITQHLHKGVMPSNIICGIMWSGPSRWDVWNEERHSGYTHGPDMDMKKNPIEITGDPNWYVFGSWCKTPFNKLWYRHFQNPIMDQILTTEHILRTQWFLDRLGINYFMTTYMSGVFPNDIVQHPEVKYLHDQIDWSKFLPVEGCYEWCRDSSGIDFPDPDDLHPSTDQHELFVDQVIIPWLTQS